MKKNCWEYKKCGREPKGSKAHEKGVCPATTEGKLNGVHGGINAGRACWVVPTTLCEGEVQESFAQKFKHCKDCDFYKLVKDEEQADFTFSMQLLKKLRE